MSKFNSKGLTLIECVIAILILAVTVTGGLMLYTNANAIMSLAMRKKMALEMAVQEMEKIKSAGYAGLKDPAPPPGNWEDLPDKTYGLFAAHIHQRITDVTASPDVLKKVELEVFWTEGKNSSKTIKLETLISPPPP